MLKSIAVIEDDEKEKHTPGTSDTPAHGSRRDS